MAEICFAVLNDTFHLEVKIRSGKNVNQTKEWKYHDCKFTETHSVAIDPSVGYRTASKFSEASYKVEPGIGLSQ